MKVKLFLAFILPFMIFAQKAKTKTVVSGVTTFSSGSSEVQKFNNSSRLFNDWAISVGGGGAFMNYADLTSFYDSKVNWGWNAYLSIDKQISHAFGISLLYQKGQTNQKGQLPGAAGIKAGIATAYTKYNQVSIIGDVNFSNLFRRIDSNSNFKWALHGYGGVGFVGYRTQLLDNDQSRFSTTPRRIPIMIDQDLDISSFFFELGTGLKYKINRLIDVEARVMYIFSGDDEFDGGGFTHSDPPGYNLINDSYSDDMFTTTLGLTFKLGKHRNHLTWYDPLQNAYQRTLSLENKSNIFSVCKSGDLDNDGICDDWDRQLDTPPGARVDGSGIALDMDLDGVIDLYDKCVTVQGPISNNGCPIETKQIIENSTASVENDFEGIEFELNSDKIKPKSFDKLNHAAEIIKTLDKSYKYIIVGATDARGSEKLNKDLSQRRANAVLNYLVEKGVSKNILTAEGHGKLDLKYPECDPATKCPEWKNEANRRVYFIGK
ncbi:OmpA family protein [Halpernia sp.]|uniref:OmpA family protein n=1 Tax=Halpernia sp. TaxID=2782209 RepID=UPI003A90ED13